MRVQSEPTQHTGIITTSSSKTSIEDIGLSFSERRRLEFP
jgi:hypothetical protein